MSDNMKKNIRDGIAIFFIEFIISMIFQKGLYNSLISGILVGSALTIFKTIESKKKQN